MNKSVFFLLNLDPIYKKQILSEEKNIFRKVLYYVAPIFIAFGIIDYFTINNPNILEFLFLRSLAVLSSLFFYDKFRGTKYGLRKLLCFSPYLFYLQYITINYNLSLNPYFAGIALIIFPAAIYLPTKFDMSLKLYSISLTPLLSFLLIKISSEQYEYLTPLMMSLGMILLCSVCSDQMLKESIQKIENKNALNTEIRNSGKIINQKVNEITTMKAFEKQFSPQIIREMQKDPDLYHDMKQEDLVIVVFDVIDSTKKASELDPENYRYVIEEVFDLINYICLKWDITIDKFTGDGAQVFAGSPKKYDNDLERALKASAELFLEISKRQHKYETKWNDQVGIKIGISVGQALVGFLGKGAVKSFTAIGATVSFTHRLCSKANSNEILLSAENLESVDKNVIGMQYTSQFKTISEMKGIEGSFKVLSLKRKTKNEVKTFYGHCETCSSDLILDTKERLPKVICQKCIENESSDPIAA